MCVFGYYDRHLRIEPALTITGVGKLRAVGSQISARHVRRPNRAARDRWSKAEGPTAQPDDDDDDEKEDVCRSVVQSHRH